MNCKIVNTVDVVGSLKIVQDIFCFINFKFSKFKLKKIVKKHWKRVSGNRNGMGNRNINSETETFRETETLHQETETETETFFTRFRNSDC